MQALPDARSMALSRGGNTGTTIVYIGTRERKEVAFPRHLAGYTRNLM